jgi:hypothetical protein
MKTWQLPQLGATVPAPAHSTSRSGDTVNVRAFSFRRKRVLGIVEKVLCPCKKLFVQALVMSVGLGVRYLCRSPTTLYL